MGREKAEAYRDPEREMTSSSTFMVVLNQIGVTGAPLPSKTQTGSHYQATQMIVSFVNLLCVLALNLLALHITVIP